MSVHNKYTFKIHTFHFLQILSQVISQKEKIFQTSATDYFTE